ncbi:alpha/beta hydrolase [Azospirillum sp. TSO22-1]|uniref:alpha/beta fold hydrolase n=1 Tax=Azospirillum sp. TSO22-1 TaxID=716789 RepID=UPI000D648978|nr:alpha/beta hydrolase [Azospirillum sp. TSO22-1]
MSSTLSRRQALALALAAGLAAPAAGAASGVGAVLLHGKGGRPPRGPLRAVSEGLRTAWVDLREPTLPWAESRYIEGTWNDALGEIGAEVAALRRGSAKVVLVGQSLGACAALSYAARRRDVDALCLVSPGHLPSRWISKGGAVRDSIEEARALVASGKGAEVRGFNDENQGKSLTVRMRADAYLSYFDPEGDAEMPRMAPLVSNIPVLYVVGTGDPGLAWGKPSVFDRLPANPRSRYVEVSGDHFSAGSAASDTIVGWVKGLA